MGRLTGKVAVCTASADGMGRAIVEKFVREGAKVVATDVDGEQLKELEELPGVSIYTLDPSKPDEVKEFAATVPKIDILCNCVGKFHYGSILDCDNTTLDDMISANVKSVFVMTKEFIPKMVSQGKGGSVINIASIASSIQGFPNHFAFGLTKAAVIGMTKSVAVDFAKQGINVNAICPDTVENPSLFELVNTAPTSPKEKVAFVGGNRFGRFGTLEELTGIAVLLASNEGRIVTGTTPIIERIGRKQSAPPKDTAFFQEKRISGT